jgi:hypothetical protein
VRTPSKPEVRVIVRYAPDVARQVEALLLVLNRASQRRRAAPAPETTMPPGAPTPEGTHDDADLCEPDGVDRLNHPNARGDQNAV